MFLAPLSHRLQRRPAIADSPIAVSALGLMLTFGAVTTSNAQGAPKTLNAGLADYLEMPSTGNFAVRDARSQVARINFLIEEPGNRRIFVSDSSGPLYVVDKRTKQIVPYINFNGSGEAKGLFPRFMAEGGFASELLGFAFDPNYRRNGTIYTIHLEDMTSAAPATLKTGVIPGMDVSKYVPTPGIPTPSGPAPLIREAVIVEWTDTNIRNSAFEGSAPGLGLFGSICAWPRTAAARSMS